MSEYPQPGIPSVGHKVWTCVVSVSTHGWHVSPSRGLLYVGNWALNPYHHQGLRGAWATFWRTFSGAYFRREYPKSERMLRRAVAVRATEPASVGRRRSTRRGRHGGELVISSPAC